MPKREDINTVLVIGSGPIIIGQACEFDYSGTQACKALRGLGYKIVLVNSNPATIMTDKEIADKMIKKMVGLRIFEDENGISFKVRDLIYNNTYHFGCRDEYLSTILKNENFFEKAEKVVEEKYGQKLVHSENTMSIDIIYDDNNQITTDEISQLVQEVLNIVNTPKVKYPAEREFSTNVVNYYTLPALGVLQCYIEKNEIGETELFYFSDKSMEQSVIKEKIDKLYQSVEE